MSLSTNDRSTPRVTLQGEASIRCAIDVQPQIANLGKLERGDAEKTMTLTLKRGDGGPIAPKVLSTGRPNVTAAIEEVTPGEEYRLTITAKGPWPNDRLNGMLTLETGVEKAPRDTLTYFAMVTPRLATRPQRPRIPLEREGVYEERIDLIWSNDAPPGEIREVRVDMPHATAELVESPERYPNIVLRIPEEFDPGARAIFNLTVTTSDPQVPYLRVPIYIDRRPAAAVRPVGRPVHTPPASPAVQPPVLPNAPALPGTESGGG